MHTDTVFDTSVRRVLKNYKGPAKLSCGLMIRLLIHPSHHQLVSLFLSLPMCRRSNLLTEEWGEGGRRVVFGAKSFDREKTWPSINPTILSGSVARLRLLFFIRCTRLELRTFFFISTGFVDQDINLSTVSFEGFSNDQITAH